MKVIKLIGLAVLALFCYLSLAYLRLYLIIGDAGLKSPYLQIPVVLENPQGVGTAKYAALGDSLTAGVGSSTSVETFPYQYALKLSEMYATVNLVNLALPGGTTVDVIGYQLPRAIDEKPDYVTLLIGINDLHNKRTLEDFRQKYQYIVNELLTKTNAEIMVINIPYLGSDKVVYPPFNELLNARTQQFNGVISGVINEANSAGRIRLVDLYTETYEFSKQDLNYYSEDLFHPSGPGYLIWGLIINAD